MRPDHPTVSVPPPLRPAGLLAAAFFGAVLPAQVGQVAVRGLDPVALCRGQEVAGRADLAAAHFAYRYQFGSEANLAEFRADPERWCIQWGGACARMGPLSGRGDPDRWTVYDGRIYIFASDACRDGFLKQPHRFAPRGGPQAIDVPDRTDAERKGRDAIARAVEALGGDAALDAVDNVTMHRAWTSPAKDGQRLDSVRDLVVLPDRVRRDEAWGDYVYATVATGSAGFCLGNDGVVTALHPTGACELRAEVLRYPALLLRRRGEPEFVAVRTGTDTVADRSVDLVRVQIGAVDTTLAIARDDGAVLQQRLECRTPQLTFGHLVETYSDWRPVGALRLPHAASRSYDGAEPKSTTWTQIEVNTEVDQARLFTAPFEAR